MAFNPTNKFINDLSPQKAIGVNLPFNASNVFQSNYQTKDAIKNNLINYLLTNPRERIRNPYFGAGLRNFIFEQIKNDSFDFIKEEIQNKISINFPLITINSIIINKNKVKNLDIINIKIDYSINNTNIKDNLNINFS